MKRKDKTFREKASGQPEAFGNFARKKGGFSLIHWIDSTTGFRYDKTTRKISAKRFLCFTRSAMATIKDVARMAGVSISTVSKYLNGGNVRPENLEPIRSAIAALDYRANPFARCLKAQRSRSIGILLPNMAAPFFGTMVMALDTILREHGYHSMICCYGSSHGLERDYFRFLLSTGVDGMVYVPEDLSAEEFRELTAQRPIPVVQVDRAIQGVETDAVLVNNMEIVYNGVCGLLDRGHRRVAIITGPKSVFTAKERLVGYLRAMSDYDLPYDDSLVHSGELTFATGYTGFGLLMQLPNPPTAIICTNYDITLGVITAAQERGIRLPEQIDLLGFDCVEVCSLMTPALPVVQQPEQEIGRTAAAYLLQRLDGCQDAPRQLRLEARLVNP